MATPPTFEGVADPRNYPFCPYCDEPRNQMILLTDDYEAEIFECPETGDRYSVRDAMGHVPEKYKGNIPTSESDPSPGHDEAPGEWECDECGGAFERLPMIEGVIECPDCGAAIDISLRDGLAELFDDAEEADR